MRRFHLEREKDFSGVSGIGRVAEGIEFDDGQVAICWLTKYHIVSTINNIRTLEAVHGHDGATKIVWMDDHHV